MRWGTGSATAPTKTKPITLQRNYKPTRFFHAKLTTELPPSLRVSALPDQGHAPAANNLTGLYLHCLGALKDICAALQWFSAEHGDATGQCKIVLVLEDRQRARVCKRGQVALLLSPIHCFGGWSSSRRL